MNGLASDAWTEIIGAAAVSPLGVTALVVLVGGTVVVMLVKPSDKAYVRLSAIAALLVSSSALAGFSLYTAQPTSVAPGAGAAESEGGPSARAPARADRPAAAAPPVAAMEPRRRERTATTARSAPEAPDCGKVWTGWTDTDAALRVPCPDGCVGGAELERSFKLVGFPPRPQVNRRFQCVPGR